MTRSHVTPTEIAEATYQATRARRTPPTQTGPAGIPIPHPRAIYRPTIDGKVLKRLSDAAYAAHRARELPARWRAEVISALMADLDRRFPAADMAVLSRYGMTITVERFGATLPNGKREFLVMPEARALPPRSAWFTALADDPQGDAPAPPETMPFFEKIAELDRCSAELWPMAGWPGRYHVERKLYPHWEEVEAAWPILGAWMREQREGARG